jgi:hypothetical protein
MALIDVALQHRLDIVRRRCRIEVGKLDRREYLFHRGRRCVGRRAAGQVAHHAHGDFRLGHRLYPALQRHRRARQQQRALHQEADHRCFEPEPLHAGGGAEPDLPAERFLARGDARLALGELQRHAARDARIFPRIHNPSTAIITLFVTAWRLAISGW